LDDDILISRNAWIGDQIINCTIFVIAVDDDMISIECLSSQVISNIFIRFLVFHDDYWISYVVISDSHSDDGDSPD